ncbi:hypothetical protein BST61_g4134 [Cercospora zeina]
MLNSGSLPPLRPQQQPDQITVMPYTVAKKVKGIGLLFSGAEFALNVDPVRTPWKWDRRWAAAYKICLQQMTLRHSKASSIKPTQQHEMAQLAGVPTNVNNFPLCCNRNTAVNCRDNGTYRRSYPNQGALWVDSNNPQSCVNALGRESEHTPFVVACAATLSPVQE